MSDCVPLKSFTINKTLLIAEVSESCFGSRHDSRASRHRGATSVWAKRKAGSCLESAEGNEMKQKQELTTASQTLIIECTHRRAMCMRMSVNGQCASCC